MHGEVGQTQFMPKNILAYDTGNLDVAANALSSTANFLTAHGWRAGAGYQPGEPNFAAIEAWNAAPVYQKAIALMGRQIDGGGSKQRSPESLYGAPQRPAGFGAAKMTRARTSTQ
jgi:membrane-bound lytic murein transglycosylase B